MASNAYAGALSYPNLANTRSFLVAAELTAVVYVWYVALKHARRRVAVQPGIIQNRILTLCSNRSCGPFQCQANATKHPTVSLTSLPSSVHGRTALSESQKPISKFSSCDPSSSLLSLSLPEPLSEPEDPEEEPEPLEEVSPLELPDPEEEPEELSSSSSLLLV